MKMNEEPKNTGQKPTKQLSFCPVISKNLWLGLRRGHEEENKESSPPPGKEEAKTDDSTEKKKEKKKHSNKNKIKTVLKKIRKTTKFLPSALQSPYAYEMGEKSCETCIMDKEKYRSVMKSVKIIELTVDGVILKEQKEMLDKENNQQDVNKQNETVSTEGEEKVSMQFEEYCEKDIDHNLKCVLVKLQKTIGGTLLQLCYCKTLKNPDDEKCKKYDVSINVMEHIKFEYTNLTNSIIRLFRTPPNQKHSPEVCVACMKQELAFCTEKLEELLRTGRSLEVFLRNDNVSADKCCARDHPHVHVLVQDKPVVLKFKLPLEVALPSQGDNKVKGGENVTKENSDDLTANRKNTPKLSSQSVWHLKNVSITSETPEEHAEYHPLSSGPNASEKVASKSGSLVHSVTSARGSATQDGAEKFCGCNFSEVYEKLLKLQQNQNEDVNLQNSKPLTRPTGQNEDEDNMPVPEWPEEKESNESDKSLKSTTSKTEQPPDSQPLKLMKSESIEPVKEVSPRGSIESRSTGRSSINSKASDVEQEDNKDVNSEKPKPMKRSSISDSDENINAEVDESTSPMKRRKQVSFFGDEQKSNVFFTTSTSHSVYQMKETQPHSVFKKQLNNQEQLSASSKSSVLSTSKQRKQSQSSENSPQRGTKQILRTDIKVADVERKPSRSLNKQQVSEVLKDLSATTLLSASFPAEYCKNDIPVNDFKCISNIPLSASLHSLPLDQDDLNHITQAVVKLASNEDIVLSPDCYDKWETEYVDNLKEENEDSASNICIGMWTDEPVTLKRIPKSPPKKETTNLQTADEEDKEKSRKSFLAGAKSETKGLVNKNRSTSSFKTTEQLFFTVEYQNAVNKTKTFEEDDGDRKEKLYLCPQKYHNRLDRYFLINPQLTNTHNIEEDYGRNVGDDSRNICSSLIKKSTEPRKFYELSENQLERRNKKCRLSPLDKKLMHDVIHLTSNAKCNKCFTTINSSKTFKPGFNHSNFSKPIPLNGSYQEAKEGLTRQNEQSLRENSYAPLKNNYRNEGSFFTVVENSTKDVLQKQTYWEMSSGIKNVAFNNIKCIVTNNGSHAGFETQDDKVNVSCNKLDEHDEINELVNNHPSRMSSVEDASEDIDEELVNDKDIIPFTPVSKERVTTVLNCAILERNKHFLNNEKYFDWHNLKEKLKSKGALKINLGSKLKTKNNCDQKVLRDFYEKEEILQQFSTFNYKSTSAENEVDLKSQNFNHRSKDFKIVDNLNIFKGKTYQQNRKPSLINTFIGFKSLKLKINKPMMKFPRVINLVLSYEIPVLVVMQKNHAKVDFILFESCMSAKTTRELVTVTDLSRDACVSQNRFLENKSHGRYIYQNLTVLVKKPPRLNFHPTSSIADVPFSKSFSSEHQGVFYLFDVNGLPLTDGAGRPLRNISGETLLKFDEAGLPLCDLKNGPVFDSFGCSVGEKDFKPFEFPSSDVLKILSPSGDPMVLYDFEGQPLTSTSGTMLINSVGEGLLRFGCTGNPVSDYRGKPIFDADGKQVVDYK